MKNIHHAIIGAGLAGLACANRWLYAFTSQPLGTAYLQDLAQGLNVCGDYCLGSLTEDAWLSGDKLGKQLIKTSN